MSERDKAIKCLRTLRNLLSDDEDLKIPIHDEKFLIRFVRGKKYDAELARDTVRKYYALRKQSPKMFRIAHPSNEHVKEILETNAVMKLKHNDQEGRAIIALSTPKWNPGQHTLDHMGAAFALVIEELLLFSVDVQINGVVIIGNLDTLSLGHMKYASPARFKSLLQIVQGSFPLRVKQMHFVKEPKLFEVAYAMLKPFLTAKLKERWILHGQDLEKFHSLVPAEKLPEEYGGMLTDEEAYDQTFKEDLFKRDIY